MYYGDHDRFFCGTRIIHDSDSIVRLEIINGERVLACSSSGSVLICRMYYEVFTQLGIKRTIEKYAIVFCSTIICFHVDYVLESENILLDTLQCYVTEYNHHLSVMSKDSFIIDCNGLDVFIASTDAPEFIMQQCIPVLMSCDNPIRIKFRSRPHSLYFVTLFIPYTMEIILFYSSDNLRYVMSTSDTLSTGQSKSGCMKSGIICTVKYDEISSFALDEVKYLKKCGINGKTESFLSENLLMDNSPFQTNVFRLFIHYSRRDVIAHLTKLDCSKKMDPYVDRIMRILDIVKPKAIRYYDNLRKYDLGDDQGVMVCLLRHDLIIMSSAFREINCITNSY
jgi:hypothetical protein